MGRNRRLGNQPYRTATIASVYLETILGNIAMNYLAIKHLHMTAAVLSILFFVIRAYWSVTGSSLLQHRLVKTLPHVIDTVLLAAGIALAAMIGANQPWILAKIVAQIGRAHV